MATTKRSHRRWQAAAKRVLATSTVCYLCGEEGADSVDHLVPLALGGQLLATSNLRPAHIRCNSQKGMGPPITRSTTIRSREW